MTEQLNILTFDVEDWFHILDNESTESEESWGQFPTLVQPMTSRILNLLDDHDIKATFFVLGSYGLQSNLGSIHFDSKRSLFFL